MSIKSEKIIAFLAQGIQPVKICEIVDCTEAYISQVKAEEGFAAKLSLATKKYQRTKEEEDIEDKYIKLESKVLTQIEDAIPFAEFGELTRAMETLIRRRQQSVPAGIVHQGNKTINVTMISVPQAALPEVILNSEREMIAVNGKSLAPMSSSSVRSMFDNIKKKKKEAQDAEIIATSVRLPATKPHRLTLDDE